MKILALSLIALHFLCQISTGQELIQAPAAIHISSKISEGNLEVSQIIKTARNNDIDIVILTDADLLRWEYGIWPLRKIIKKTVELNSVFTYGIKQYLRDIKEAQERNPDLVLIPGVESAPFYYWSGSPLKNNLKMNDWHKHILVVGLERVSDYKNLPSVSNPYRAKIFFRLKDIHYLWPMVILGLGILCLRKRKFNYKDISGYPLGPYSLAWRICGIILISFSLLFLYNNSPFYNFKYDPYYGDARIGPYQTFIDYVNQKGGLSFWAHPEKEYIEKAERVDIETKDYTGGLLKAQDYTGFAIFYEGYEKVGRPGGIWDEILKQYCQGKRKQPVWAIGGLGFEQSGDLGEQMRYLRTIVLIPSLTKQAVLKALKEGKIYVVKGTGEELILNKFVIQDSLSDNKGISGDQVFLKGKPIIKISGHFLNGEAEAVEKIEVKLIRNGQIIKTFEVSSPFKIDFQDEYFTVNEKIYYRLEIRSPHKIIITNPIFVRFVL